MKNNIPARTMLISSMTIFGTLGLFVRNIAVSSGELALYRAILAAMIIGLVLLIKKQPISFQTIKKILPLLLISGFALGFNWILLFEAYRYTTVSAATLSYYFAPVLVTAVCPLLFREKITAKQWFCLGMSTLGIVLITGVGNLQDGNNHLLGIAFGLGAACLYATVVLINKFIKDVEGLHRTLLQFLVAILVLIPYVACTCGFSLEGLDLKGWICLLIVGFVHTGLAYCLYFPALKALPGQKAAILSYIDPLIAVVISVLLLGEAMTPVQWIGGAMILGFTLLNEISPPKNKIRNP